MPTIKLIVPDAIVDGATYTLTKETGPGQVVWGGPAPEPTSVAPTYDGELYRLGNHAHGAGGSSTAYGRECIQKCLSLLGIDPAQVEIPTSPERTKWNEFYSSFGAVGGGPNYNQELQGEGYRLANPGQP